MNKEKIETRTELRQVKPQESPEVRIAHEGCSAIVHCERGTAKMTLPCPANGRICAEDFAIDAGFTITEVEGQCPLIKS